MSNTLLTRALVVVALVTAILIVIAVTAVSAQTTTFRDRAGNVTGYSHTDSNGTTTFRDRNRNVVGTARTR